MSVGRGSRRAIIDIGSNSIRLVVYGEPLRIPAILFNEKVMAGLGRDLGSEGRLSRDALDMADQALARFAALTREYAVDTCQTVATAAVREAKNGDALIAMAERHGLAVTVLSGDEEAVAAGRGVLSAFPDADGIVGDLGGGSLELVRVKGGAVGRRVSLPLGVLRLGAIRAKGRGALDRHVAKLLAKAGWEAEGRGLPFYLVGGSWRALARIAMEVSHYPLPVIHGYRMDAETPARLVRLLARASRQRLRAIPSLSSSRIPTLADAAALLSVVRRRLDTGPLIASAFGLREGLLFGALPADVAAQDPLIVAARCEGALLGRFEEHGDLIAHWIAPLFSGDASGDARLRHAACLLADVGWRANPEFRAERGIEVALHGNWVGIDGRGRAMVAQALATALSGATRVPQACERLASPGALARAMRWGLAIRLAQRLSGGLGRPLGQSSLALNDGALSLRMPRADWGLYGDAVQRRHKQLATAFDALPVLND